VTYPQLVTAYLVEDDGTTVVSGTPLANAFNATFMDELSGPGTGTISVSLSEAGSAELLPGRYVVINVDGPGDTFAFMIEGDPEYTILGEGEEAEAILTVTGRGVGALLDLAIVEPEVALGLRLDAPWRLFSFASPSFPNAGGWAAADELYEYLDGVSYGKRFQVATDGNPYPSPISFPVPTSPVINDNSWTPGDALPSVPGADYVPVYWIWPTGEEESSGWAFFRNTFTISTEGVYNFAITADNFFTLFLEGVPILGENVDHWIWRGWKEVPVHLPVGTYDIAVVVENFGTGGPTNPAGLIMTVHTVDGNQLPDTVQLVTDDSWDCFHSETVWPGWTPGQIVDKLLDEAVARGALTPLGTPTFAATTDSASNAWADVQDGSQYVPAFACDIGSTIMAALGKLKEEGHIDWHMNPDFTLDVWTPDSLGTDSGVDLVAGTNLRSLVRGATTIYANALLVQYELGYVWVLADGTDGMPDEIGDRGDRIEDIYASEAATEDEAIRQGQVELLNRIATGFPAIIAEVEPVSASDAPYEGFVLGELVTIPAVGGGTENVEVLSISLATDDEGYAKWTVELNRRWRSVVRQNYELLRDIGGRSGYGNGVAG
jgi:hypothetical protein